jgi:hypothetical protein
VTTVSDLLTVTSTRSTVVVALSPCIVVPVLSLVGAEDGSLDGIFVGYVDGASLLYAMA